MAIARNPSDPRPLHLLGKKLSQHYRFRQRGRRTNKRRSTKRPASCRRSCNWRKTYCDLGREEEGWLLAEEVHAADEYDVDAYNLATLRDALAKFTSLEDDDFIVRMSPREAASLRRARAFVARRGEARVMRQV